MIKSKQALSTKCQPCLSKHTAAQSLLLRGDWKPIPGPAVMFSNSQRGWCCCQQQW
jgi:hypothetical protein